MAHLANLPQVDEWVWWARAFWRGAAACAAVALLLSAWSFSHGPANGNVDLEDVVVTSVNEADVTW